MPTTTTNPKRPARLLAVFLAAFGICLMAAAGGVWFFGQPAAPDTTRPVAIGGPFTLTDGDGKTVTEHDLEGKFALIYFGYTYCPDVCPTTLQQVTLALDKLGPKADQVRPVFITVDPGRDTPKVVASYTAAFSPRLLGLTGTEPQLSAVEKEFHVYAAIRRSGAGDYSVDHSSVLYLMGPDGKFVAPIDAAEPGTQIAADIAKHLS